MSSSDDSPIPEYLYIDQARLGRYFEHTKTPPKYAKVSSWTARLTLPIPTVEGSQQKQLVSFTLEEKIELLRDYLRKQGQLAEGRITDRAGFSDVSKVFRLETCEAVKAFIPATSPRNLVSESDLAGTASELGFGHLSSRVGHLREQRLRMSLRQHAMERARSEIGDFKGLSIWFSDRHHAEPHSAVSRGQLFLVVEHPWKDDNAFQAVSAHSALVSLFSELQQDLLRSALSDVVAETNEPRPNSAFQQKFLADPLAALAGRGALLTGWRAIQALYRVRTVNLYRDPEDDEESFAAIGYTIVITAMGW
jgi:hypothetical protein